VSETTDAFDSLIRALDTPDPIVRADAARLLGELGHRDAVPALVRYVTTDRHYHKVAGIHALMRVGDPAVITALQPMVEDPNCPDDWYWFSYRSVRAAAAVALLALGDDSGAEFLTTLADRNDDVFFCWYGPAVLGLPDNMLATAALKLRFTTETIRDGRGTYQTRFTEPGITVMTARTLGLIGDAAACAVLLDLMKHHSRYVRAEAGMSLLAAAPSAAHEAAVLLLSTGSQTDFERIKGTLALLRAGVGNADAVAEIAKSTPDDFDRAVAIETLGIIGDPSYTTVANEMLAHQDAYVRQCAVEALDRLEGTSGPSLERLRTIMKDDQSPRVRLQAAKYIAGRASEVSK
jgi:HEAT repeat protein